MKVLDNYKNAVEFAIESIERGQRVEVALDGLKKARELANEH